MFALFRFFDFPVLLVVVWESKDDRAREGEERVRLWGGQDEGKTRIL